MVQILAIPALKDNYIWVVIENNRAIIIDPGEAGPVFEFIDQHQLSVAAIFITHHHWDHSNGAAALKKHYQVPVYCSEIDRIEAADYLLNDNDTISLPHFSLQYKVIAIPGHTKGHIAFYTPKQLFCGDTLFAAGCGKLFEGTAEEMYQSLQKLASLPAETNVYCGHEYTLKNLEFAQLVEPGNLATLKRLEKVKTLRKNNLITLPSSLSFEKQTNPFLRCDSSAIQKQVEKHTGKSLTKPVDIFYHLREWKDAF